MVYTIYINKVNKELYCVYLKEEREDIMTQEEEFESELEAYRFAVRVFNNMRNAFHETPDLMSGIVPTYDITHDLPKGQTTLDKFTEDEIDV